MAKPLSNYATKTKWEENTVDSGLSFHAVVTAFATTLSSVLAFFVTRLVKQVDINTKDLADHRTEDAGKYATNADVKDSLNRIHDRIDTISEDIKTLIGRRA